MQAICIFLFLERLLTEVDSFPSFWQRNLSHKKAIRVFTLYHNYIAISIAFTAAQSQDLKITVENILKRFIHELITIIIIL